jgi:hypothetical protein
MRRVRCETPDLAAPLATEISCTPECSAAELYLVNLRNPSLMRSDAKSVTELEMKRAQHHPLHLPLTNRLVPEDSRKDRKFRFRLTAGWRRAAKTAPPPRNDKYEM